MPFVLIFQACNQLELATHIEMSASLLCLNAIRLMKGVLAGTKTKKLQDVLEAAFCEQGVEGDDYIPDEEEEEKEAEQEASTSTGVKCKAPPPTPTAKRSKVGICALSDAVVHYPTTSEAQSSAYLHVVWIPDSFLATSLAPKQTLLVMNVSSLPLKGKKDWIFPIACCSQQLKVSSAHISDNIIWV